jgi:hypothetical protein
MRLILGVLVVGCSANRPLYLPEPEPPAMSLPDLTSPSLPDLTSATDLAQPASDLGGYCGGTGVAGTCVQSFFAGFADCFQPQGPCVTDGRGPGPQNYCWSNGAKLQDALGGQKSNRFYFNKSGALCLTWKTDVHKDVMIIGDTEITFAPDTGVYSCDGESVVGIAGPDCGGCAGLCAIVRPPTNCTIGDCL